MKRVTKSIASPAIPPAAIVFLFSVKAIAAANITYDHRSLSIGDRRQLNISAAIPYPKSIPAMWSSLVAGIDDVFTSSRGSTKTLGNFVKATFNCFQKTYGFLTPEFWKETRFTKSPYQENTDLLAQKQTTKAVITEVEDQAS